MLFAYPVSCCPQAWSSGVGSLLTRSMLGLRFDEPAGRSVVEPSLPPWIGTIALDCLVVRGRSVRLVVHRHSPRYGVEATGDVAIAGA